MLRLTHTGTGPLTLSGITLPPWLAATAELPPSLAPQETYVLSLLVDASLVGPLALTTDATNAIAGHYAVPLALDVVPGVTLDHVTTKAIAYTDADGTKVLLKLRGTGTARASFTGQGLTYTPPLREPPPSRGRASPPGPSRFTAPPPAPRWRSP